MSSKIQSIGAPSTYAQHGRELTARDNVLVVSIKLSEPLTHYSVFYGGPREQDNTPVNVLRAPQITPVNIIPVTPKVSAVVDDHL